MQHRAHKYYRDPSAVAGRLITPRHWEIVSLIQAYPFLPTSLLLALAPGNPRRTGHHLQTLFHFGVVNRFYFPITLGNPGPFHYFIDSTKTITGLAEQQGWSATARDLAYAAAERNQHNGYGKLNDPIASRDITNKTLFLQHEVMISRFHARLELASRASQGQVRIAGWMQGPTLNHKVQVPKLEYTNGRWVESDELEQLPHEPDAYFVLHFPNRPAEKQYSHFLYEADRHTMNVNRMNRKFRAHFHYIIKKRLYREQYGIPGFQAVVVETTSERWAEHLRKQARSPIVSGYHPTRLFYFGCLQDKDKEPKSIFDSLWKTPADSAAWSLIDERPDRY